MGDRDAYDPKTTITKPIGFNSLYELPTSQMQPQQFIHKQPNNHQTTNTR